MYRNISLICGVLFATATITAFSGEEPKETKTDAVTQQTTQTYTAEEEQNITKKLNTYIDCYNGAPLNRSIKRYSSWVKDMSTGPTGKENVVYGTYQVDMESIEKCLANIEQASKLLPKMDELDQRALNFAENSGKLAPIIQEIYAYYDEKDYKDDDFKKGKELHAPFLANAKLYYQSYELLGESIAAENDKRLEQRLVTLEKAGHNYEYFPLAILLKAKALIGILHQDEFPIEETKTLLDDYAKLLNEANSYAKDPKNEKLMKRYGILASSKLNRLISTSKDFNKAAKNRLRRVRDKKPYSSFDQGQIDRGTFAYTVEGSPQSIAKAYGDLVNKYNSL